MAFQHPTGLSAAFSTNADTALADIQVTDLSAVNMFMSNNEDRAVGEEQGNGTGSETVINDDILLDPRILQESLVGGVYFAPEQRSSTPLLESQLAGSREIQELPPTPTANVLLSPATSPSKISPPLPNLQQPKPTPLSQSQRFPPTLRLNNLSRPEVSILDPPTLAGRY